MAELTAVVGIGQTKYAAKRKELEDELLRLGAGRTAVEDVAGYEDDINSLFLNERGQVGENFIELVEARSSLPNPTGVPVTRVE